jgi:hypothetical protein
MKQSLTIARMTFLLAIRTGAVWGTLLLVAGVAAFIFAVSVGDEKLISELTLRVHYSYAISYSLLTLVIVATACFTVRSQIDDRQLHLLTSRPISRGRIWAGQWLGLFGIAALAELALILTLLSCAWLYSGSYDNDEIAAAKAHFGVARHESRPAQATIADLTNDRIDELIAAGTLVRGDVDHAIWKENYDKINKQDRRLPAGAEKTWAFDLGAKPTRGDSIEVKFRMYANHPRKPIQGTWRLSAEGQTETFEQHFEVPPHVYNSITIPLSSVPADGRFDLTLVSRTTSHIDIRRGTGLRIYHSAGTLWHNLAKAVIAQLFHLAVTVSVGLLAGIAFTFPVASFLAMVLYFLSISSGMFDNVVRDLSSGYDLSWLQWLGILVINIGLWLTKGLQPPPVATDISGAISIPLSTLAGQWFPGIILYGIVISLLGIVLLKQKELDKIPSTSG